MKMINPKHNIESAFVLVLFAVFAVAIVAVLALGARTYKGLVERDNDSYNKRIITSYVSAKIRNNDVQGAVAVGGFANVDDDGEINTLHMYQDIEGATYDLRVYYYDGKIYELLTLSGTDLNPEDGNAIMDAQGLSFAREGNIIHITAKDADGRENRATVTLRSGESGVSQ